MSLLRKKTTKVDEVVLDLDKVLASDHKLEQGAVLQRLASVEETLADLHDKVDDISQRLDEDC